MYCRMSLAEGFKVAYRGGMCLGFFLTGIGLLNLLLLIIGYKRKIHNPFLTSLAHDFKSGTSHQESSITTNTR